MRLLDELSAQAIEEPSREPPTLDQLRSRLRLRSRRRHHRRVVAAVASVLAVCATWLMLRDAGQSTVLVTNTTNVPLPATSTVAATGGSTTSIVAVVPDGDPARLISGLGGVRQATQSFPPTQIAGPPARLTVYAASPDLVGSVVFVLIMPKGHHWAAGNEPLGDSAQTATMSVAGDATNLAWRRSDGAWVMVTATGVDGATLRRASLQIDTASPTAPASLEGLTRQREVEEVAPASVRADSLSVILPAGDPPNLKIIVEVTNAGEFALYNRLRLGLMVGGHFEHTTLRDADAFVAYTGPNTLATTILWVEPGTNSFATATATAGSPTQNTLGQLRTTVGSLRTATESEWRELSTDRVGGG